MKKVSKKQIGQVFRTAFGIMCVGVMFCLALVFPGYYYQHYDNNTLNQVTYTDINVNTYEASYDSFGEKLRAIARVFSEKKGLQAVRMDEIGFEMSRADLTKIVNKELKKLNEYHVLDHVVKLKKKHMILYERYILYGQSGEENFKGISFWKLVYNNKKRKMTFYLDEEFQKIYYLEYVKKDSKESKKSGQDTEAAIYDMYGEKTHMFYNWWDGIVDYYGLSYQDKKLEFLSYEEKMMGEIVFDGRYTLYLHNDQFYDEEGPVWKMGLPMEKMIQF